mgnify:CR=1 FL=1
MATYDRQNSLIANEDWDKIYQAFSNADFSSYDFPTLRRTMIQYLRNTYPEDFNDYIESSEYLALIDIIAFLGQSLSYRFDLNARENFIELAEKRESVLRLARLVGYQPKRNVPSNGLLKVIGVQTTESVVDSLGNDVSNRFISWNDDTNANWLEQLTAIMNSAMPGTTVYGKPNQSQNIDGVQTEQYRLNTQSSDVPLYNFAKSVGGRSMGFEVVSVGIEDSQLQEETPLPGRSLGFLYQNDSRGNSSPNTGWFFHFKQGQLNSSPFTIDQPSPNEIVNIDVPNINNNDVWLWQLNRDGAPQTEWTKLNSVYGSNVIYNSINKNTRTLYTVVSRDNDQVSVNFADGNFGDLPRGTFQLYYRTSNGISYSIRPTDMQGIVLQIPYFNKSGQANTLTVQMGLQSTVTNANTAETTDDIRINAPQAYYTQNRMITGEDYNTFPLTASPNVIKVKAVNRISSGISREYEITDPTGKYSSTNIIADDGILYKNYFETDVTSTFQTRNDILGILRNNVETIVDSLPTKAFYYDKFPKINTGDINIEWVRSTELADGSTGYFRNSLTGAPITVGSFTSNNFKYVLSNTLIKFIPPTGKYFLPDGKLTTTKSKVTSDYIWSRTAGVTGDGSNNGAGNLDDGSGPITFTENIPTTAIPQTVMPNIVTNLPVQLETQIVDLMFNYKTFGIRYDQEALDWKIIANANLNTKDDFSLERQGDVTGAKLDKSWFVLFETDGETYSITYRGLDYRFESEQLVQFFVDKGQKKYDNKTGKVIKDQIKVLKVNEDPVVDKILSKDYQWEIVGGVRNTDGFEETNKVRINFYDSDDDGMIDDPDSFINIVKPENLDSNNYKDKFVFFKTVTVSGITTTTKQNAGNFIIFDKETSVINLTQYENDQLFYFYDDREDVIKKYNTTSGTLDIATEYFARSGRDELKFQYIHNAENDRRIDPSKTNIIDLYILNRNYDNDYRAYINTGGTIPQVPTSEGIRKDLGPILDDVKSISDEIIYHPVKYRPLFGSDADSGLQANFKVVKSKGSTISDNEIKSRAITSINDFFNIDNWDFGDSFYFTELATYVQQQLAPEVANFVIVPRSSAQAFGSLFQITSKADEILISTAQVEDVDIIDQITASNLKAAGNVVTAIDSTGQVSVSNSTSTTGTGTNTTSTTSTTSTGSSGFGNGGY